MRKSCIAIVSLFCLTGCMQWAALFQAAEMAEKAIEKDMNSDVDVHIEVQHKPVTPQPQPEQPGKIATA